MVDWLWINSYTPPRETGFYTAFFPPVLLKYTALRSCVGLFFNYNNHQPTRGQNNDR